MLHTRQCSYQWVQLCNVAFPRGEGAFRRRYSWTPNQRLVAVTYCCKVASRLRYISIDVVSERPRERAWCLSHVLEGRADACTALEYSGYLGSADQQPAPFRGFFGLTDLLPSSNYILMEVEVLTEKLCSPHASDRLLAIDSFFAEAAGT